MWPPLIAVPAIAQWQAHGLATPRQRALNPRRFWAVSKARTDFFWVTDGNWALTGLQVGGQAESGIEIFD